MTRLMKIVRRSPQTTLVVREEMYYPGGSRDGGVSHVQHLQRYPHVRSWRRRVERVIEHTDYAEYVGEDPAALPRSRSD